MDGDSKSNKTFQIAEIHVWCGRCGREMRLDESSCSCDRIRRADPPGGGPMGMTTRRYRF